MILEEKLAILVPTRNRPAILKRTLAELSALGFGGHPLVVFDDASDEPDAIAAVVSAWPGARILRGQTRSGQAKGRNELMRACPCEYALFLDDDSFPEERESLVAALHTVMRDGLAIATFTYKALKDGSLSVPSGQPRGLSAVFLGGASIFNVPAVLAIGGYRECLVYGYEEPELALRLWLSERRVEFLPNVNIIHNQFYTADEKRDYSEYDYLYARNAILWSSLNLPLLLGLPHGLARSVRRSFLLKRNFGAKLRGTFAGVATTFSLWSQRSPCSLAKAVTAMRFMRS